MIDLHTHSLFSDGELLPTELIRRGMVAGYEAIAITDHADASNLDLVIPRLIKACSHASRHWNIKAIAGIELTHVPPPAIPELVDEARRLGAGLVVVHGETIVEPVTPGTNLAALQTAGVDILAHPGLLTPEEAQLAAKNGVALELSARKGHCLTNGHVARLALEAGAKLILATDAHAPGDLISQAQAEKVALGAGLPTNFLPQMFGYSRELALKCSHGA